jgi:hypothetical protein
LLNYTSQASLTAEPKSALNLPGTDYLKAIESEATRGEHDETDSDEQLLSEDMFDLSQMTLEEKILKGYFSAKPYVKDAYPESRLNRPNLPEGKQYKH